MVYKVTEETITEIANAIRAKTGSTEEILVQDFAEEILTIQNGENTIAAAQSARDAEASAISAASSAQSAKEDAALAAVRVNKAKDWAIGSESTDDETYENNSKYYSEVSLAHSKNSETSSQTSKGHADRAAASEAATKESQEATDENLSRSIEIVENLEGFNSEAWAVGTKNGVAITEDHVAYNNHSKYWSEVARDIIATANVLATATIVEEVTS